MDQVINPDKNLCNTCDRHCPDDGHSLHRICFHCAHRKMTGFFRRNTADTTVLVVFRGKNGRNFLKEEIKMSITDGRYFFPPIEM